MSMTPINLKAERLANSASFDVNLWSDDPKIEELVECVFNELNASAPGGIKGHQKKFRQQLKVILLNLLRHWQTDPAMYTSYHRGSNFYSELDDRYNKNQISRVLIGVVDVMAEVGLIENHKGHYDRSGSKQSHVSRMKATEELIEQFSRYGVSKKRIKQHGDTECIIMRQNCPKLKKQVDVAYKDTRATKKMRKDLMAYNALLAKTDISVLDYPITGIPSDKGTIKVDFSDVFVKRIFNDNIWDHGGRFYGGWWQRIPEAWREKILINKFPVFEVDYSGLHPILLYALEGIDYWKAIGDDPYQLKALKSRPYAPYLRKLMKKVFLAAINASSKASAIKSIQKDINFEKSDYAWSGGVRLPIKDLISHFQKVHAPISKYLFTGYGKRLQNLDSGMAEQIINQMTADGVVVLCIHDSFVVDASQEEKLRQLMRSAFQKTLLASGVKPEIAKAINPEVKVSSIPVFPLSLFQPFSGWTGPA